MTVVRFKNRPNGVASFNNLLSDVFPQMPSLYKDDYKTSNPVNIKETETEFVIEVVAPGFTKEDFSINLENDTLTIAAERKEEAKVDGQRVIRNEFAFSSFKRSFTLDEKIDAEKITAQYVNGVMTLNLGKKEDVKPATKQITIN